jgi:hypothetical protein
MLHVLEPIKAANELIRRVPPKWRPPVILCHFFGQNYQSDGIGLTKYAHARNTFYEAQGLEKAKKACFVPKMLRSLFLERHGI